MTRRLPPMHPGEVLREEYLKPLGLSPYALAAICHIPRTRLERIVHEATGISVDTALRLAKVFNTTPDFWMNLQIRYEVEMRRAEIATELERIEPREYGVDPESFRAGIWDAPSKDETRKRA